MSRAEPRKKRAIKSRRETNIEATRAALLDVARKHFARVGYSRAEIGQIAADARVTTGAVYHHFDSKKGLFVAVAEEIEAEILKAGTVDSGDPLDRLRVGFERSIDYCASPAVQRITFIEAPQVIGPDAWYKIELRYAYGALRQVLAQLIGLGVIKAYPIDFIAQALLALLRVASAEVARSKHDPTIRANISEMIGGFFNVLTTARSR